MTIDALILSVQRCPTLPRSDPRSTIGAEGLNGRGRNGNGWSPLALVTEHARIADALGLTGEVLSLSLETSPGLRPRTARPRGHGNHHGVKSRSGD
jgi:hypothetical protein